MNSPSRTIVISGINLRSGGTLSILQDCLSYLQKNHLDKFQIVALVHDKSLFAGLDGIEFIEFPSSIKSYLYRIYYEYFYFKSLSKKIKPYLWFSLHDMTPAVVAEKLAVYCHNPSPFFKLSLREAIFDPGFTIFNFFYTYVYSINIKRNDYVIVQQEWIRDWFHEVYGINSVVVAYPDFETFSFEKRQPNKNCCTFFFPTLPRFFKNIEVIVDAVKILNTNLECEPFEVNVTIDGTENRYARHIAKYSAGVKNINLIGKLPRTEIFSLYGVSDCLIFPSKLETWGLPITEFKQSQKPMLIADLPYAHETVGDYKKVGFFAPDNPAQLAKLMFGVINQGIEYTGNKSPAIAEPFAQGWSELFDLLLTN